MNGQDDFNWAAPPPPPAESAPGEYSLKEWIVILALVSIPCVNVILLLYWAFGAEGNPTRKKFAQAYLIVAVCVGALFFLIGTLASSGLSSLVNILLNAY